MEAHGILAGKLAMKVEIGQSELDISDFEEIEDGVPPEVNFIDGTP